MKKIFFLLLATLLLKVSSGNAQDDKFKALFIYNFTKMIEWPADKKTGDFVIVVMGNPTIAIEILGLKKQVVNQPIVVKEVADASAIGECHMLFIGGAEAAKLNAAVGSVAGKPTLVISDVASACQSGASINFIKSDSGIDYEYSLANLAKQKLSVSLDFKSLGKPSN